MYKRIFNKNSVIVITFFIFIFSYFSKLTYQLGHIDEINYLSDSLLLLEGMLPSSKHAPSGVSTWLGTIIVLLDLFYRVVFVEPIKSILDLFVAIDKVIYFHYNNLIYIKFSLFLLNLILLIYLYFLDNTKKFFILFLLIFTSPLFIETILTGKPFFTAAILFSLSLFLKKKNYFISLIFLGLAISEKWEYILLINFICYEKNKKINIKDYLFVLLIFIATSPWFIISFLQNLKIQLNFILWNSSLTEIQIFPFFTICSLIIYILLQFVFNLINNKKIRTYLLAVLFLIFFYLVFLADYYIRWFIPLIIILIYEISENIKIKNFFYYILCFISIIFQIKFNLHEYPSNSDWINLEEKSDKKIFIVEDSLLKEKNNYKNYFMIRNDQLKKNNIKNLQYFNDLNAPISFSESSLIEKSYLRRFEYIQKYSTGKKEKYLYHTSGIKLSVDLICNMNYEVKEDILIIKKIPSSSSYFFKIKKNKFSDYIFESCD